MFKQTDKTGLHLLEHSIQLLKTPLNPFKASISRKNISSKPVKIFNTTIAKISSTEYVKVGDGIYNRLVKDVNDFINQEEKNIFKEAVKKVNFKEYYVLFVRVEKETTFPLHVHDTLEKVTCVQGAFVGSSDSKVDSKMSIYSKGSTQIIEPHTPHIFKVIIAPTYSIIQLKKT